MSEFFVRTLTKSVGEKIIIVGQQKENANLENLGHVGRIRDFIIN